MLRGRSGGEVGRRRRAAGRCAAAAAAAAAPRNVDNVRRGQRKTKTHTGSLSALLAGEGARHPLSRVLTLSPAPGAGGACAV
eukprot:scaffold45_cov368-Prasinococcus_capsulatus_cf.AAC.5